MRPRFDKQRCLKCKYHNIGTSLGYPVRTEDGIKNVYCDYLCKTGKSPIKPMEKSTIDLRGDSYHHCELFKED